MSVTPGLFIDLDEGESGRRVVLIHGAMDRHTSFSRVRKILSAHTTIAYDRRGYARSIALGAATSLRDHVDDLLSVIGDAPSVLVGHSYGGILALCVAAQRPELAQALVVFESPMPWTDWWPGDAGGSTIAAGREGGPAAAAESFMRRIVGDRVWERLGEETRAARRAEGNALLFDLVGLRDERGCPYDTMAIRCPVIVGFGSNSASHQQQSARELYAMLAKNPAIADEVEIHELADATHGAHARAADLFAGLVELALNRS